MTVVTALSELKTSVFQMRQEKTARWRFFLPAENPLKSFQKHTERRSPLPP